MEQYGALLSSCNDYLIYDERKGRVLHTRHLTKAQFYEIWRFHFRSLRPDLQHYQLKEYEQNQRLAKRLAGYLRSLNGQELTRIAFVDSNDLPSPAMQDILINQYKYQSPNISVAVGTKITSWRDAAYTNQWFEQVKAKIGNYGLDYPYLSGKLTPDKAMALEEKLYEVFKEKLSS